VSERTRERYSARMDEATRLLWWRRFLTVAFSIFAFISFVMEALVAFQDLTPNKSNPLVYVWWWYASSFDPLFLHPPDYMRAMLVFDMVLFGPFHVAIAYAIARDRRWILRPAWLYAGAMVYSTLLYFAMEFFHPVPGTNIPAVIAINVPYTILPFVLLWYLTRRWGEEPAS
jgi:EXPERA (EXPanded EBP superfamily)